MMKQLLIVLIGCLALSVSAAQDTAYLGVRLVGTTSSESFAPMLGVQLGVRLVGPLNLRLTADTLLVASSFYADLLYTYPIGEGWNGYAGVGADYLRNEFDFGNEASYGAHIAAGAEYRSGIAGFFTEVTPLYTLTSSNLGLRLGLGVNFYLW